MDSGQQQPQGPPYLPASAPVGGIPTTTVDVPICVVILTLYLLLAATHALIYRRNARSPRTSFKLSIFIVYMCFLRLVTMSLRIAWSQNLTNTSVALAAQIFTTAGVLLIYIVNIVFCQRILRAWHPRFGWSPFMSRAFPVFYALVPLSFIALLATFIQSLYTTDAYTRQVDHSVSLYGVTFFVVVAAFPVPFILVAYFFFVAKKRADGADGVIDNETRMAKPTMAGNVMMSAGIVFCATLILLVGSVFRAGTAWVTPPPPDNPAWFDSKACFYVFNFVTELVVVLLYAVLRVDKLFFVPKEKDMNNGMVVTGSDIVEVKETKG